MFDPLNHTENVIDLILSHHIFSSKTAMRIKLLLPLVQKPSQHFHNNDKEVQYSDEY